MKTIAVALVMTAALAACGGKSKKPTTPSNTSGSTTDMKASGSAAGGSSYGGAMGSGSTNVLNDPCMSK